MPESENGLVGERSVGELRLIDLKTVSPALDGQPVDLSARIEFAEPAEAYRAVHCRFGPALRTTLPVPPDGCPSARRSPIRLVVARRSQSESAPFHDAASKRAMDSPAPAMVLAHWRDSANGVEQGEL